MRALPLGEIVCHDRLIRTAQLAAAGLALGLVGHGLAEHSIGIRADLWQLLALEDVGPQQVPVVNFQC